MTKGGSASVGLGCGLAAAAVIAFATWPSAAAGPGPGAGPGAASAVELTGSDDRDDEGDDEGEDDSRRDDAEDVEEADDGAEDEERLARTSDGTAFELEIDPELDARFGPRPVNGVRAAEIAVDRFGGRVVAVELDEEGGRPIWEVELAGAAADEVDVDAIDGRIR